VLLLLAASAAGFAIEGTAIAGTASDPCLQPTIPLQTAGLYAVLAHTSVTAGTGVGSNIFQGLLGISPKLSFTGIGFVDDSGLGNDKVQVDITAAMAAQQAMGFHLNDDSAKQAQLDLDFAINNAKGRELSAECVNPVTPTSISGSISAMTFTPGLYNSPAGISLANGPVYLKGDADGVFIFQAKTTFVNPSFEVILLNEAGDVATATNNGAQAKNVFWQVGSSATLGAQSHTVGTILAEVTVTMAVGAKVDGRVLARTASVTMMLSTVTMPANYGANSAAGAYTPVVVPGSPVVVGATART
jgi:hypothetical protein